MRNTTKTISRPVPDDEPVVVVGWSACEKEGREGEGGENVCYFFGGMIKEILENNECKIIRNLHGTQL